MRHAAVVPAALALALASGSARAYDAEVRADTYAQAYEVRGPAGSPVISSRAITQTLSLNVVERPRDPRGITVAFRARLRFDAEFGEACDPQSGRCLAETTQARSAEWVPIFAPRTLDVPYAYLDVTNIAHALDVRAGRIFQADALGFLLFDGARARTRVGGFAVIELLGGLETRSGFPLSNGRFERDGLIRADRSGWDATLAPYVLDRSPAPVVGASVETAFLEPFFARVTYRRVWSDQGLAEEKLGGSANAIVASHLLLYADAIYSAPQRMLANLTLSADWVGPPGPRVGVEYNRFRPTFDLASIWASFWTDATDELRARGELRLSRRLTATGAALVRRYALSESGPSAGGTQQPDAWNAGGAAALLLRAPAYQGSLRARIEGGDVGLRAGMDLDALWWLFPNLFRLDARLSLWHVEDNLRPERAGFFFSAVLGATARLGPLADLHLDAEDDVNPIVGQRLRLLAVLSVRGDL